MMKRLKVAWEEASSATATVAVASSDHHARQFDDGECGRYTKTEGLFRHSLVTGDLTLLAALMTEKGRAVRLMIWESYQHAWEDSPGHAPQ